MPTTLKDFESVFPQLVEELLEHCRKYKLPQNALEWYEKSLKYNSLGGKCNRGLSVPDTVALLTSDSASPSTSLTPESPHFVPACVLGWLIELLQAFFLVSDDIMDASLTRRGQPAWYRASGVGMIAINDSFMLESAIYIILKKHFRKHKEYSSMLELFHEVTFQTELGQSCDLITAPEDHVDLNNFSMDKFTFIVHYKTAYYSFYLPVALALHYCGLASEKNLVQSEQILIPMGEYFQAQDDYLDCFADPSVLGKIGTDIQDNKCSWVVNQALQRASGQQRQILDQNYGRKDKDCEQRCKAVFEELRLQDVYQQYEEEQVKSIKTKIEALDESEGLKKSIFEEFLRKIYKRTK